MNRKRYPKYETCDLMHNGICVSNPCICKGMSMSKKKNMKTEIDPMMESEYMSWDKKQQALSPGPWYLQIGDGSMPYYIMTPLDKTMVAATIYRVDAERIIDLENECTALSDDLKQLHKEFTQQAIKIDEKNVKIQALRKALEDIQYMIDPLGSTGNDTIYNIALNALKK